MSFRDYLGSKAIALCMGGIGILYLTLIVWLCGLPLSLLLLLCFIGVLVLALCLVCSWRRVNRRLGILRNRLEALPERFLIGETLECPRDAVERQYYLLMKEISRSAIGAVEQARAEKQDYCDYVESWVHEIKTPLTACSLILANGGNPSKLRRELRRADNLTETILTYAKIREVEKDTQISFELIKSGNGDLYYPVFTDGPEMKKCEVDKDQHSLIVNFDDLAAMLLQPQNAVAGFVINPMSDNICFSTEMIAAMKKDMEKENQKDGE